MFHSIVVTMVFEDFTASQQELTNIFAKTGARAKLFGEGAK